MNPRRILFLISAISSLEVSKCVEIHKLSVPSLVKYGAMGEVFLDCDFNHSVEEEKQLEVKWYHNDEHSPFFQWLPGSNRSPQVIGDFFRDHLDPNAKQHLFPASSTHRDADVDARPASVNASAAVTNRNHTLRLFNIVPELSGTYKCKVSSLIDEDFKQMDMLVYSYPEKVEFEQRGTPALEEVEVECAVRGIYPQPKIAVTWLDRDGTSYSRFEPMLITPNANDSSLLDCALHFKLNQSRCNKKLIQEEIELRSRSSSKPSERRCAVFQPSIRDVFHVRSATARDGDAHGEDGRLLPRARGACR